VTIPAEYHEFFVATAGASGALIGLLFVAVSVFPERARHADTRVEYRARASAALLVFSNALVLSLAALIPRIDLGWWACASAVSVLLFAAATARSVITAARGGKRHWALAGLVIALLTIAFFEFYGGIRLIIDDTDTGAIGMLDYVVIGDIAAGIARAWQLVAMRDTGVVSSLRTLAHGDAEDETKPA
jgi:hypothetical protein